MGSAAAVALIGCMGGSAAADVLFLYENLFELILIYTYHYCSASIDRIDSVAKIQINRMCSAGAAEVLFCVKTYLN